MKKKNSLFKENFQESVNLRIRNFGKLMINLEIKRFKRNKINNWSKKCRHCKESAGQGAAFVDWRRAEIKSNNQNRKNKFSWTQNFFSLWRDGSSNKLHYVNKNQFNIEY